MKSVSAIHDVGDKVEILADSDDLTEIRELVSDIGIILFIRKMIRNKAA